jgi:hypothetical protein
MICIATIGVTNTEAHTESNHSYGHTGASALCHNWLLGISDCCAFTSFSDVHGVLWEDNHDWLRLHRSLQFLKVQIHLTKVRGD